MELFSTHYKYSYTHVKKTPLGTSSFAAFHARYGSEWKEKDRETELHKQILGPASYHGTSTCLVGTWGNTSLIPRAILGTPMGEQIGNPLGTWREHVGNKGKLKKNFPSPLHPKLESVMRVLKKFEFLGSILVLSIQNLTKTKPSQRTKQELESGVAHFLLPGQLTRPPIPKLDFSSNRNRSPVTLSVGSRNWWVFPKKTWLRLVV